MYTESTERVPTRAATSSSTARNLGCSPKSSRSPGSSSRTRTKTLRTIATKLQTTNSSAMITSLIGTCPMAKHR
jgi:hypothetical protein